MRRATVADAERIAATVASEIVRIEQETGIRLPGRVLETSVASSLEKGALAWVDDSGFEKERVYISAAVEDGGIFVYYVLGPSERSKGLLRFLNEQLLSMFGDQMAHFPAMPTPFVEEAIPVVGFERGDYEDTRRTKWQQNDRGRLYRGMLSEALDNIIKAGWPTETVRR